MTTMIDVTAETMQKKITQRLGALSSEVAADLSALVELLRKEDDPDERIEIGRTIWEVIFPDSMKAAMIEDEQLLKEAAAREKLEDYRRKVGAEIRKARELAALTQESLAELASLPQSHISRLEAGKHAPTFTTMERIASALGTTADQLDPGFLND